MSYFNFGEMSVKKICYCLWILCFGIYFIRHCSIGVGNYEGASSLIKVKYYFFKFYYKFIDPIVLLFIIKYAFELVYKFYEQIEMSKK